MQLCAFTSILPLQRMTILGSAVTTLYPECLGVGADINAATELGKATPLHRAAYMGALPVLECLYASPADHIASVCCNWRLFVRSLS